MNEDLTADVHHVAEKTRIAMSLQTQFRNADFKALLETRRRELMEQTMRAGDYIRDIQGGRFDQEECLTFLGMKDDTQVARSAHAGRKKPTETTPALTDEVIATFERRSNTLERQLAGLDTSVAAILDVAVKLSSDISSAVDLPSSGNTEIDASLMSELRERIEQIEKQSSAPPAAPVEIDLDPVHKAVTDALESIAKASGEATDSLRGEKERVEHSIDRLLTEAKLGFEQESERQVEVLVERVFVEALRQVTDKLPALLAEHVERLTPVVSTQAPDTTPRQAIDADAIQKIIDDRIEALLPVLQESAKSRPSRSEKALVSSHPRFPDAKKLASDLIEQAGPSTTGAIIDAITDKISDIEISARDAGNRFSKMGLQRVVDPSRPSHRLWWVPGATPPAPYQIA